MNINFDPREIDALRHHSVDITQVKSEEDLKLIEQLAIVEARESFWRYRLFMDKRMKEGWWQREVALHLQRFYQQIIAGKKPVLVLMAPPQHGKSRQVVDFAGWLAGQNPDLKITYTSYSQDLGIRANQQMQRTMDNKRYQAVFPGTRINETNVVTMAGRYLRNKSIIQFREHDGQFYNTTVGGQITGTGFDLGIIDDPMKGRKEAQSKVKRDAAWDWLTDDFFTRFSEDAAMLMIMCLTGDTQVSMGDGSWKPLRDVKVGDSVLSWSKGRARPRRVMAVKPQGEDEIFQVRTNGSLVRGNARHPFLVLRGDEPEWVKLADLEVGDMIVQAAKTSTGTRRDFSLDEAWTLGFLLGDGWVTTNRKMARGHTRAGLTGKTYQTASFVTCIADCPAYPAFARRAVEVLSDKFLASFKLTRFGYWRTEKAALGRYLLAFGMGDGAKHKRVPPAMYQQADDVQRAFLDGFADADGHLKVIGGYQTKKINLCNRLLIDDLRHMARALGHRVTNVTAQNRKLDYDLPPNSPVAKKWFSASFGYHWRDAREQPFSLSRVTAITPCGREDVFDISVEGDANFIADGLVVHNTRWHVDDPVGRFLEHYPDAVVLSYPAIATEDEFYRMKGEPLFPEHKSLEFLLRRKGLLTQASWESLYQQNPIIVGGGLFPIEKFGVYRHIVPTSEILRTVRYWDKAGTEDGGAWTCGVRMHHLKDGRFVVDDVVRGQWAALEREQRIKQTAELIDGNRTGLETWVEQEPGSSGKESALSTIQNLAGFTVFADRVTGAKEIRAEPYAAQVQAGNVYLMQSASPGHWTRDFLDEHEKFPSGKYKDQVDAAAGAFSKLTVRESNYDDTLAWVG